MLLTFEIVSRAPAACYVARCSMSNAILADDRRFTYPNRYADEPVTANAAQEDLMPFWFRGFVPIRCAPLVEIERDALNKHVHGEGYRILVVRRCRYDAGI